MTSPYGYIAYIDEAGDPGIRRVLPIDPNGASEWLVIAAIVVRASRENEVIEWVKDIRNSLGIRQRPDLHFRNLNDTRKMIVCRTIAELPLRAFVILSNKKNMRGYRNKRAEKVRSQEWFYNWCLRLLLERVTGYCHGRTHSDYGDVRKLKIEFSRRGGLSYSQTKVYHEVLKLQSESGNLWLPKREIKWQMLDRQLADDFPHNQRAGLQLADVIASAFYQAVNVHGAGRCDTSFAKLLKPRMAVEGHTCVDYGVTLQPTPPWKAKLTSKQREIFEFYGFEF